MDKQKNPSIHPLKPLAALAGPTTLTAKSPNPTFRKTTNPAAVFRQPLPPDSQPPPLLATHSHSHSDRLGSPRLQLHPTQPNPTSSPSSSPSSSPLLYSTLSHARTHARSFLGLGGVKGGGRRSRTKDLGARVGRGMDRLGAGVLMPSFLGKIHGRRARTLVS